MYEKQTIAAIATGLTDSGVGIIRISGNQAVEVGNRMFVSISGKSRLDYAESHKMYYGYVVENKNPDNWKDYIIDEVMAVVMKAPKSYTGEDTVEIQCHGGVLVMKKILQLALKNGARMAEPGEFSKRAFLNGRMDLTQAEAVMDLIHSQNEMALNSSVSQLRGSLNREIKDMRSKLIHEIAFIEAALDDPEHFDFNGYDKLIYNIVQEVSSKIENLISTTEEGKLIKEGIKTVIIGRPNAGKSSLMNLLVGEERAIVTDIAGTTRDVITENVRMGDVSLQIIDTAGIRDSEDIIEKIGVEKAIKYAKEADLILYVVDSSIKLNQNDKNVISILNGKKCIVLLNKSDMEVKVTEDDIINEFKDNNINNDNTVILKFSVKTGNGMDKLSDEIQKMFFNGKIKSNQEIIITNIRHKEALQEAYDSLIMVEQSIENQMPEDFLSIDLMNAYSCLGRIIGEEVEDDLVEEIFHKFCLGK